MRLADYIEYKPSVIYDQNKVPMCAATSFFCALKENIEQEFEITVNFDPLKEYKYLESLNGRNPQAVSTYTAKLKKGGGFITSDGKYLVQSSNSYCVDHTDPNGVDVVRKALQINGALIWSVHQFKNYDIKKCNSKKQLKKLPKNAVKKADKHGLVIIGYDKDLGFKFQNSWGEKNTPRYVDTETFLRMTYIIIAFEDLILTTIK